MALKEIKLTRVLPEGGHTEEFLLNKNNWKWAEQFEGKVMITMLDGDEIEVKEPWATVAEFLNED